MPSSLLVKHPSSARAVSAVVSLTASLSVLLGVAAAPPALGLPGGSRVAVPATIDSTGTTDVTEQLSAFLNALAPETTVEFRPNGRYRVEGSLILVKRDRLTLLGNGATLFATTSADRNRRHVWFQRGNDIVVRQLNVKGANPDAGTGDAAYRADREAQHGFDFGGVRGVELDRVTVTDVYGDFVYFGMRDGVWTSNGWVHDSTFARNGRQGMAFTGARNILIERNSLRDTRRATFDLEPNGADWGVSDVTIRNNTIGAGRLLFIAAGGRGPVDRVTIRNNDLSGRPMNVVVTAPAAQRRSAFQIVGNRSDTPFGSPAGAAMLFTNVDGIQVTDNVVPLQRGRNMAIVDAETSCRVVVARNKADNAATTSTVTAPSGGCSRDGGRRRLGRMLLWG